MTELSLYLNFPGTCEEAFSFYHSVFGGELTDKQTFAEMGGAPQEGWGDKLVHIRLQIENISLMGTDRHVAMGAVEFGNAYSINFNTNDDAQGTEVFKKLSEGGKVITELQEMFWGAKYGQLTDKYGIQWMVNIEK